MIMNKKKIGLLLLAALSASQAHGQSSASSTPIISGGVGLLSNTTGGNTVVQPVIMPVLAAPLGERWLIESRGDVRTFFQKDPLTGDINSQTFTYLEYLQADFNANSHLTITVGRFLTPFSLYNERFTPVWIQTFFADPIVTSIGTLTTGSSDGGMLRGVALSRPHMNLTYTAYFSVHSSAAKFESARATGGRVAIFLPGPRLEIGASYQKLLESARQDSVGGYFSWNPAGAPLDLRGEYAHSPGGQGYWIEAAYRLSQFGGPNSWLGRLQPAVRVQQFDRIKPLALDFLPGVDTKRVDFALNYFLPKEVRIGGSYGRQFSSQGDLNVWNVGLTWRFLFPLFPGGSK